MMLRSLKCFIKLPFWVKKWKFLVSSTILVKL